MNCKDFSESDFTKLMLELTDSYYFSPNLSPESEKDIKNKVEQLNKYWELIEETKGSIQLNLPDYQYLIPSSRDDWQKNQYYKLYKYLQDSESLFGKFQRRYAKILWCLFAYVSPTESNEIIVRYLAGITDEKEQEKPHFLFKAYHANSGTNDFEPMSKKFLDNLVKTAYYQRKKAQFPKEIDFIYILKSQRKRTTFEIENKLMYVPSGEIDTCILQWLLLYLKINDIEQPFAIDLSEIQKQLIDDKVYLSSQRDPITIYQWLEIWGLIKDYDTHNHTFTLTPRGESMLYWFATYLKSVQCNQDESLAPKVFDTKQEPDYWRVLAQKGVYDTNIYLQALDKSAKQEIIDNICNQSGPQAYCRQFSNMLKLMISWVNSNSETWQEFSERCRFSTLIHYVLRFSEKEKSNLELYSEPSGLLALPVWWDNIQDKDGTSKRFPVGVFMSIIQENESSGLSYFKDFDKLKNSFTEKISAIKAVIVPIARIESIEVYQSGIKRLEKEHEAKMKILEFIRASKHTIKNFQFRELLDDVINQIDNNQEIVSNLRSTLTVRDIATDFMYSLGLNEPAEKRFIVQEGYDSYSKILKLIFDATDAYKEHEQLILPTINIAERDKIFPKDSMHVFNVLINLYTNIRRNRNKQSFTVKLEEKKNLFLITFKNNKALPLAYVQYLNTGIPNEKIVDSYGGMSHIVSSLKELPHIKINASVKKETTTITLTVKKT